MLARLVHRAADLWHVPAAWSTVHRANVTDYTRDGRTIRTTGWEQHPVVMACTRAVVDLVQSVPLEVYKTDRDGEDTVLEGHPLEALLQNPNPTAPQMPGARFMGLTALHFLLYGNAFWHIRRNGQANRGRPAGLKLVHPEYVRSAEFSEAEDRIIWYDWTQPETGTPRRSDVNDIVHFADLAGESWLFGYPRAAAALGDIAADNEATRYVRQIVTNDGGATQIFHMQDGATREQAEGAEARWREKRINRGERGMAMFMPGTVKSETIGFNLQQLEFPDLRRVTREDICAVFGVDPRVIGVASAGSDGGLSGVQYREARRRLIAQAVSPLMFMLEAHVNHWLAPEYGEVRVRFSPNGLSELTEDELETSSRAITEYQAGLRTLEEARALVALPEQRDPAHHVKAGLLGELTVADVGTLALPSAQAALAPPRETGEPTGENTDDAEALDEDVEEPDVEEPEDDVEEPDDDADDTPPAARAALLPPTPIGRVALLPEQRAARWLTFDQLAQAQEAALEAAALAQFAADARRVGTVFSQMRAAGDPVLTPQELEYALREVRRIFGPTGPSTIGWTGGLEAPIGASVRAGAEASGFTIPQVSEPRIPKVIRQRTARLAERVGQTSAAQIEAALVAGQQAGWGARQTADMVNQTVFGGLARQRATMIARTESAGAVNEGHFLAAQESGSATEVEWLTQQDDRVRDTHMGQDGQRVALGQTFLNGCRFPGDPLGQPEEVINCRCALIYF
jgi:HK97 family phage portal protein